MIIDSLIDLLFMAIKSAENIETCYYSAVCSYCRASIILFSHLNCLWKLKKHVSDRSRSFFCACFPVFQMSIGFVNTDITFRFSRHYFSENSLVEDRRTNHLRSSGPKIEEPFHFQSSIFGAENSRIPFSSIFDPQKWVEYRTKKAKGLSKRF